MCHLAVSISGKLENSSPEASVNLAAGLIAVIVILNRSIKLGKSKGRKSLPPLASYTATGSADYSINAVLIIYTGEGFALSPS